MPRTISTIANDLIRLLGVAERFNIEWTIPVPRESWKADVTVRLSDDWGTSARGRRVYISIHAHAYLPGTPDRGYWHYTPLMGAIDARSITRRWIETVLPERIETARIAALGATEADLKRDMHEGETEEEVHNFYSGMRDYFHSTFEAVKE